MRLICDIVTFWMYCVYENRVESSRTSDKIRWNENEDASNSNYVYDISVKMGTLFHFIIFFCRFAYIFVVVLLLLWSMYIDSIASLWNIEMIFFLHSTQKSDRSKNNGHFSAIINDIHQRMDPSPFTQWKIVQKSIVENIKSFIVVRGWVGVRSWS